MLVSFQRVVKFFSPYVFAQNNAYSISAVYIVSALSIAIRVGAPLLSDDLLKEDREIPAFLLLAASIIVPELLSNARDVLLVPVTTNVQRQLTQRMHEQTFNRPYSIHVNTPTGEFAQGITSNYGNVSKIIPKLYGSVLPFVVESMVLTVALGVKFGVSAATVPGIGFLYGAVFAYYEKKYSASRKETLAVGYQTYGVLLSSVGRYKVAKQYGRVQTEQDNINPLMDISESKFRHENLVRESTTFATSLVAFIGFGLAVMCILLEVKKEHLDDIDFLIINFLLFNFVNSLSHLTPGLLDLAIGMVDSKKVIGSQSTHDIADIPNAYDLSLVNVPSIAFENIRFSYPAQNNRPEVMVLNDISCRIEAGQVVAFVGKSGVGKSTFTQLLQRFYALDSGTVRLQDQDVSQITARSLRHHLAVVEQSTGFIKGTWYDNIAYAREGATEEQVVDAARAAGLILSTEGVSVLKARDAGIDGMSLSGGEKQRIAIARAILKGGSVLILDEATSALDPKTESQVQATLNQLSVGVTTLIITHKLYTLANVDKVFYLEDGKIAEQGTCEELIAKRGMFFSQLETQLREQGNQVTPEVWLSAININRPKLAQGQIPLLMKNWETFEQSQAALNHSGHIVMNTLRALV
ncbi:MAG: ABC transporter ATP-binding protein [Gammaproteobacteria bacterium]